MLKYDRDVTTNNNVINSKPVFIKKILKHQPYRYAKFGVSMTSG